MGAPARASGAGGFGACAGSADRRAPSLATRRGGSSAARGPPGRLPSRPLRPAARHRERGTAQARVGVTDLDEVLERFHRCAFEYGPGLSNHGPMAAEALALFSASNVPEPSGLLLLSLAGVACSWTRRR